MPWDPEEIETLLGRAAAGDARAVDRLVEIARPTIAAICGSNCLSRDDSDDLIQETAVRVVAHLGDVRSAEHFRRWVAVISRHCVNDFHKKRKRRQRWLAFESREPDDRSTSRIESVPDPAPSPEQQVVDRDDVSEVASCLSKLSPRLREALALHYCARWTFSEIAEYRREHSLQGASASAAQRDAAEAKERIRRMLGR